MKRLTKTHTITGTRNGKEFTKVVEIQYDDNKPKFILKFFGTTGYIQYEELFDFDNLDEYGQASFLGNAEEPNKEVITYRNKILIENFKIIK